MKTLTRSASEGNFAKIITRSVSKGDRKILTRSVSEGDAATRKTTWTSASCKGEAPVAGNRCSNLQFAMRTDIPVRVAPPPSLTLRVSVVARDRMRQILPKSSRHAPGDL